MYMCTYLSIYQSITLSIYQSIYLSIYYGRVEVETHLTRGWRFLAAKMPFDISIAPTLLSPAEVISQIIFKEQVCTPQNLQ